MRSISFTISLALLAAFYWSTRSHPSAMTAAPYHAHILSAVETMPSTLGAWETKEVLQPPPAAQQLLKPNALLTRQMERTDGRNRYSARLILVQTQDSRDMGGHYPPQCYPGAGWQRSGTWPQPRRVRVGDIEVPYQIYTFRQRAFPRDREIKIYGFFAIPQGGFVTDIDSVRRAAENYRVRPFGCAQIQVLVDASTSDELGERIFVELMTEIAPLLKDLSGDPLAVQHSTQKDKP